jgi:hypothetical protein
MIHLKFSVSSNLLPFSMDQIWKNKKNCVWKKKTKQLEWFNSAKFAKTALLIPQCEGSHSHSKGTKFSFPETEAFLDEFLEPNEIVHSTFTVRLDGTNSSWRIPRLSKKVTNITLYFNFWNENFMFLEDFGGSVWEKCFVDCHTQTIGELCSRLKGILIWQLSN